MKNAFNKDVYREIHKTLGRFMGILAIVALGVSFYAGLGVTGTTMKALMDAYLDQQNLMDIRIVSTYGMNTNDVKAIEEVENISKVQPSYNIDVMLSVNGDAVLFKAHSIKTGEEFKGQINEPVILSGRIPIKPNEILVEQGFLTAYHYEIGDTIKVESGKDEDIRHIVHSNQLKIVGTAKSPYYISAQRGSGSIGNGRVKYFILMPEENFSQSVYSEVFVNVTDTAQLDTFKTQYEDMVANTVDKLKLVGDKWEKDRMKEISQTAYETINSKLAVLENQKNEALTLFSDNEKTLYSQDKELFSALSGLNSNQASINQGIGTLEQNRNLVSQSLQDSQDGLSTLYNRITEIEASKQELLDAEQQLTADKQNLDEKRQTIMQTFPKGLPQYTQAMEEIEAGYGQIADAQKTIDDSRLEIELSYHSIYGAISDLDITITGLNSSILEIDNEMNGLRQNLLDIDKTHSNILSNRNLLSLSLAEIESQKTASMKAFDQGYNSLIAAKKQLSDLSDVEWFVLDRESNLGFLSYSEDADKITSIGSVFPLFFFMVAALVSLTSMARMVEERRIEIGTLKSLGYGNFKILSKYLLYAIIPTFAGGVVGGYLGMQIFPAVIINAYRSLYSMPTGNVEMSKTFWMRGMTMGIFTTLAATIFSCVNELKSEPNILMRPKAPKIGKKTLIEQINFIWQQLSFMYKISIRNIFRYKKRFIMTILGISGCTALLITGFGLKDSIADIMNKQFGYIIKYDFVTSFSSNAEDRDIENALEILNQSPVASQNLAAKQKNYDIGGNVKTDENCTIIAAENVNHFTDFVGLKDRKSGNDIHISSDGVVISENLATILKVTIGDEIQIKDGSEIKATAVISDICENYYFHYIYMSMAYYEQIFNEKIEFNSIYSLFSPASTSQTQDALADTLLEKKNITGVSFTHVNVSTFNDVMGSLNIVVFVLIISAGLLVFVVLLNLTNINIAERIREIATIEVLGFKDSEVTSYIYRENIMLTFMGILAGFVYGKYLHMYVISTAESRLIMFGRDIHFMSYVYSTILTFVFAMAANMVTSGKLKKISMVEALKSVE